jgi:hypothetical protein
MCCTKELTVSGVESFPGELDTLRADNVRLRRLLQLSEEQARAAASDQATGVVVDSGQRLGMRAINGEPADDIHLPELLWFTRCGCCRRL